MRTLTGLLASIGVIGVAGFAGSACGFKEPTPSGTTVCSPGLPCPDGGGDKGDVGGTGGAAGAAGAAGTAGTAGTGVTVTGTVAQYLDDMFATADSWHGDATISADKRDGTGWASTSWNDASFTLTGLKGYPTWVRLETTEPSAMMTFHAVVNAASAVLPFVPDAVMQMVADESAVMLDANDAQLILRFVDTAGTPLSDVSVTQPAGADAVAYEVSTFWNAAAAATGTDGLAAVFNIPTIALPGNKVDVDFEFDSKAGKVTVWLAKSAVTVVTAEIRL